MALATLTVNPIADLRSRLAEKRMELRRLQDDLPYQRAVAEQAAIRLAGGDDKALGSNAEARSRALALALGENNTYQRYLSDIRVCELGIAQLEAELEAAYDARRAEEWAIRSRLCEALANRGLERPSSGATGSTIVMTEAACEEQAKELRRLEAQRDINDLWP